MSPKKILKSGLSLLKSISEFLAEQNREKPCLVSSTALRERQREVKVIVLRFLFYYY